MFVWGWHTSASTPCHDYSRGPPAHLTPLLEVLTSTGLTEGNACFCLSHFKSAKSRALDPPWLGARFYTEAAEAPVLTPFLCLLCRQQLLAEQPYFGALSPLTTIARLVGAPLSAPLILCHTESRCEGKGMCHGLSWSSNLFNAFSPTPPFALALAHFGLLHGQSHLLRWQKRNLEQNIKERVIVYWVSELNCLGSGPMRPAGRTGTIRTDVFRQGWRFGSSVLAGTFPSLSVSWPARGFRVS